MKQLKIMSYCRITDCSVIADGKVLVRYDPGDEDPWLLQIYKALDIRYPKFHKMDNLCKAGFIGAEMVMKDDDMEDKEDWAVVTFNRSSSSDNDIAYQKTIADPGNYYPAPSLFVYTLPNILTGEIAIRHRIFGESSHFISREFPPESICNAFHDVIAGSDARTIIGGWTEYWEGKPDVLMLKASLEEEGKLTLTINNIIELWKN